MFEKPISNLPVSINSEYGNQIFKLASALGNAVSRLHPFFNNKPQSQSDTFCNFAEKTSKIIEEIEKVIENICNDKTDNENSVIAVMNSLSDITQEFASNFETIDEGKSLVDAILSVGKAACNVSETAQKMIAKKTVSHKVVSNLVQSNQQQFNRSHLMQILKLESATIKSRKKLAFLEQLIKDL
jgi:vacuolar-type H+-ATPase catalytic subunit A/Vma1